MTFKQEFLAALRSGKTHESLLGLVRRYQQPVSNPQEIYETLQEIWLELGFDAKQEGSPTRDELEYVMEKIWYQCPT